MYSTRSIRKSRSIVKEASNTFRWLPSISVQFTGVSCTSMSRCCAIMINSTSKAHLSRCCTLNTVLAVDLVNSLKPHQVSRKVRPQTVDRRMLYTLARMSRRKDRCTSAFRWCLLPITSPLDPIGVSRLCSLQQSLKLVAPSASAIRTDRPLAKSPPRRMAPPLPLFWSYSTTLMSRCSRKNSFTTWVVLSLEQSLITITSKATRLSVRLSMVSFSMGRILPSSLQAGTRTVRSTEELRSSIKWLCFPRYSPRLSTPAAVTTRIFLLERFQVDSQTKQGVSRTSAHLRSTAKNRRGSPWVRVVRQKRPSRRITLSVAVMYNYYNIIFYWWRECRIYKII